MTKTEELREGSRRWPSPRWPSPRWRATGLLLCVIAATVLSWSGDARAEGELVVVLDFEGPRGSQTRAAVVGALRQEELELVPLTEFQQAAQDAGVSSYTGRDLIAACRPLGAAAAVSGEVLNEGGLILRMTLRNCADGEVLDVYTVGFRGRRMDTRAMRAQITAMVARLRAGARPPAQDEEPEPEPAVDNDREEGDLDDEDGDEEEENEEQEDGPAPTDSFLDVSLTLALANRNLEVDCPGCTLGGNPIDGVVYRGGAYSEIGLNANFYPLRLGSVRGIVRNLGLRLNVGRHLVADSEPRGGGPEVSTSLLELAADVTLSVPLLDDPRPPSIGFALGYGLKDFVLGENQTVASMQYRFVRIGIFGFYPIHEALVPFLSFGYRVVMSVGDAEEFYGPDASSTGFDAMIGVRGAIATHFIYELGLEWTSFDLTFTHPADRDCSVGLCGNEGNDTYLRTRLSVGYAF